LPEVPSWQRSRYAIAGCGKWIGKWIGNDESGRELNRGSLYRVPCMRRPRSTQSLVPEYDVTVHIVLDDFGSLGRAYRETDEAEADEATIIDKILSGQCRNPLRVVALKTVEGWTRDVSEDIARAVLKRA
jgi:hypothetical protein